MRLSSILSALLGGFLLQALPLAAPASAQAFNLERVTQFITEPVAAAAPPGDTERVFVVSNTGRIFIIKNGQMSFTPFLSIGDIVQKVGEGGMLGLAFHPDYDQNGYFYVSYTTGDDKGDSIISRFTVSPTNPDFSDPATRVDIWGPLIQDQQIHRSGALHFGPDGMLYFSLGDGGPTNDPLNRAQDINDPRGSILRFDVDAPFPHVPADNPFAGAIPGDDHIWAYGLRNPYRFGIDSATGDLYIADVGQSDAEEINFLAAGATAPANFGWRCMEGTLCTGASGCGCADPSWTVPVHEYDHSAAGGCAVIGGEVYRGSQIPSMQGRYLFSDFCTSRLWSFRVENGQKVDFIDHTDDVQTFGGGGFSFPGGFGTDGQGELYLLDYYGDEVFKMVPVDPWSDLAGAKAGSLGDPLLTGDGTPMPGNQVTLELSNAVASSPAALVIGFSQSNLPLLGGTLVPSPDLLVEGLNTGSGTLTAQFNWPASLPGPETYFQYWFLDLGVSGGVAASNAVEAKLP